MPMDTVVRHCVTCGRAVTRLVKHLKFKTAACSRQCMSDYYRTISGDNSPAWRGGKGTINSAGYLVMRRSGKTLLMHRLTMEEHLGRPLVKGETVHHINGNKADNRIENLQLFVSQATHISESHRTPKRLPSRCLFCKNAAKARGLCNAHYKKAQRNGILRSMPRY